MKLVDTSAWIHSLRPDGDKNVATRVRIALESGEAAWCAMVRLELWNGARGAQEKRVLRDLEATLPNLEMTAEVWQLAIELARKTREKGLTIPATDLLIAACAGHHGADLVHADSHFDQVPTV
ncbi:MAG: PIN domain nuclease [Verrucomicrobia bacterium]|nr:PIN domain nuclease [Verrucomicrobiota bacterium]